MTKKTRFMIWIKVIIIRPFMMFILVCTLDLFGSLLFMFYSSGTSWTWPTSIVSITHTVIFSTQEVSRQVARGSPGKTKCSWNSGKKKQLNYFSMYFVRNNEEIHLSFKNSKKQWTQALILLLCQTHFRVLLASL